MLNSDLTHLRTQRDTRAPIYTEQAAEKPNGKPTEQPHKQPCGDAPICESMEALKLEPELQLTLHTVVGNKA